MKATLTHFILLTIILSVALITFYIMRRTGDSFITVSAQWIGNTLEGFAAPPIHAPHCPTDYTFFNDSKGDSFCCAGTVNPYTHVCTATEPSALCAFADEAEDPRGGRIPLPRCADLMKPAEAATKVTEGTVATVATEATVVTEATEGPIPVPNQSPSVFFSDEIPAYGDQFALVTVATNNKKECGSWQTLPNFSL